MSNIFSNSLNVKDLIREGFCKGVQCHEGKEKYFVFVFENGIIYKPLLLIFRYGSLVDKGNEQQRWKMILLTRLVCYVPARNKALP